MFVYINNNHYDIFNTDNYKWCARIFIELTDEKLKPKLQVEDEFIYIMN